MVGRKEMTKEDADADRETDNKRHLKKWKGVSLSKPLLEKIEKFIDENPEEGYSCLADFLHEAIRLRWEEKQLKKRLTAQALLSTEIETKTKAT